MFHVGDEVQVLNHNHNHHNHQHNNSHSPSYSYRDRDGVDVSSAATANANATDAVIGEVVEERGGGWYSVKVKSSGDVDSSVVIKQRGSGLSLLSSSQNISNKDGVTFSLADAYKKTKFGSNNMIGIDNVSQENVNDEVVVDQNNHAVLELSGNTNGMPSMKVTRNNNTSALLDLDMAMKMNKCSSLVDESLLAQCHNHASFHKWIVFTDLHVAPSTLDTCLEVLDFVHTSAQERGAGIIFLGDFWHHRGTVRIDCLNAVLNKLSTWNVPMIMIPGNHDQVTLGGLEHALTPLQYDHAHASSQLQTICSTSTVQFIPVNVPMGTSPPSSCSTAYASWRCSISARTIITCSQNLCPCSTLILRHVPRINTVLPWQ